MMAPSPSPVVPMQVEVQPVPSVIACKRHASGYPECELEEPSLQICYTDTMGTTTDFDSDAASVSSSLEPVPRPPQPQQSTPSSSHRHTQTVRVNVGGEAFSFPLSAFQRFLGLPWKRDSAGVYCLNQCSAAVFEVLLDYTLFGTMPAYDTMSKAEWQEFETMALAMGGLTALIEHFDRKDSYLAKELRRGRKSRRSSAAGGNRHFLINPEDSHSASPNSVSATRVARFLSVLCGVAESIHITRRRSSCGSSSTSKADHKDPAQKGSC